MYSTSRCRCLAALSVFLLLAAGCSGGGRLKSMGPPPPLLDEPAFTAYLTEACDLDSTQQKQVLTILKDRSANLRSSLKGRKQDRRYVYEAESEEGRKMDVRMKLVMNGRQFGIYKKIVAKIREERLRKMLELTGVKR